MYFVIEFPAANNAPGGDRQKVSFSEDAEAIKKFGRQIFGLPGQKKEKIALERLNVTVVKNPVFVSLLWEERGL